MHQWATDLFKICRSITGPGVRETLSYLSELMPGLTIHSVPSGTKAFDWEVPDEWIIHEAYIEDEYGNRIVDFNNNNLHVVGYSTAIDKWLELDELEEYLYSLPEQPDAIPYITSYYSRRWGFCLTHNQRNKLKKGRYRVFIDSDLIKGVLNYGELILPGELKDEVLLSTYICHPSMGNNELSGPIVTTSLAQWLSSLENRRYTYRIIFIPETIGSIVYLSKHSEHLKKHTVAGFVITCIGDDRTYSFVPSRKGNTLADRAAEHSLQYAVKSYDRYSFLTRGSDERQYCSPGIDLPVCSIMRSKYDTYPEYHTSLDDLDLITPEGLDGGYNILKKTIEVLESNKYYRATILCEPQLGKRGLYPTISTKETAKNTRTMMNVLAYADGDIDLIELANTIEENITTLLPLVDKLTDAGLLEMKNNNSILEVE